MSATDLKDKLIELEQTLKEKVKQRRKLDIEIDLLRNNAAYLRRKLNDLNFDTENLSTNDAAIALEAMSGNFVPSEQQ